jgi:predicted PurR-regulated permease PerM
MDSRARTAAASPRTSEALITTIVVVGILYFARGIFEPLAMAVLLSFVLHPAVAILRRLRLGRAISVIAVIFFAAVLVAILGFVLARQLTDLADSLPRYEETLKHKINFLQGAGGQGVIDRATGAIEELGREISKSPQNPDSAQKSDKPIAVEIRQPQPLLDRYQSVFRVVSEPLATAGIVLVFLIFIMLQREDLRDRIIRLTGPRDVQRTTAAMNDASRRLSRYFVIQTIVNSAFGCVIGVGLWIIGVPNPILWGFVAAVMRFVPFIGSYIAAAMPLALAAGAEPGWSTFLWTLALYVVGETAVGQVVEPLLYGQSTGLSPLAVIVAASFWAWLWGPVGLIMAIPLTACLVVLAAHVERFEFLYVLLNDAPALSPSERFYQRVLSGNAHEASRDAEQYLKTNSLCLYYDEVALPGLALASQDLERGALERDRLSEIADTVSEIVEDLDDYDDVTPARQAKPDELVLGSGTPNPELPTLDPENVPAAWKNAPVLALGGRTALDTAAAAVLAQLMNKHGIPAQPLGLRSVGRGMSRQPDLPPASLICVSYFGSEANRSHIGYIARRLRRSLPNARIMLCCWNAGEADQDLSDLAGAIHAVGLSSSLYDAISRALELVEEDLRGVPEATAAESRSQNAA